jgi:hypothetical protein
MAWYVLRGWVPLTYLLREWGLCAESQIGTGCIRDGVDRWLCEVHCRRHISREGGCRIFRHERWGLDRGGLWYCVVVRRWCR